MIIVCETKNYEISVSMNKVLLVHGLAWVQMNVLCMAVLKLTGGRRSYADSKA